MTVCIAAACEEGEKCVTVTDGLLTYGGIAAEVLQHKRLWKGEWELMYAGSPEHFTMILGEWDEIQLSRTGATTRRNVQETLSNAFRAFLSKASSFSVLSPFDLSLEEFKKGGLEMMGRGRFRHMSEQIEANAATIQDQILAVGWGHAPASVMIYEVSGYGGKSYANGGIAAIGSGRDVALSNLLLLGQNRSLSLARTIYNVAAAKFSAEHSSGLYVGKEATNVFVSWKRTDADTDPIVGSSLSKDEIGELRTLWEQHGRPRIPREALIAAVAMSQRIKGAISAEEMAESIEAHRSREEPE